MRFLATTTFQRVRYASHPFSFGNIAAAAALEYDQRRIRSISSGGRGGGEEHTGTVKFYIKEKGYGFIQPDGKSSSTGDNEDDTTDVFVHRSGIVSEGLTPETSVQNPYLRQGERIRYRLAPSNRAVDVVWVNGTPIPPLRANYLRTVRDQVALELGESILDIFCNSSSSSNDHDDHYNKVEQSVQRSQLRLERAHAKIERLGMKITDFPEHRRSSNGSFSSPPATRPRSGDFPEDQEED